MSQSDLVLEVKDLKVSVDGAAILDQGEERDRVAADISAQAGYAIRHRDSGKVRPGPHDAWIPPLWPVRPRAGPPE